MKKFKKFLPLYIMLIPGIAYLICNNYIPLLGLQLAFKKFSYAKGMWDSPWNGFDNFSFLFRGNDAFLMFRNTILYNAAFIVLGTILAITVAIMLNNVRSKKAKKIYQTVILIPYLISIVIVSYIVFGFLSADSGFLNNKLFGLLGIEPISWYVEKKYWPGILTLVHLWKGFGYSSIIYYSTIIGIDPTLYEAAAVDGATRWRQTLHVTLPSLKPTIITLTLMNIGRIMFSDFGLFYQVPMNSGPLMDVTQTIDTYVYRALMVNAQVGKSAASGLVQSILGFILVLTSNMIITKIDRENALF